MIEKKFYCKKLGIKLNSYIDDNQNVWFRGKDVAEILGYNDIKQVIKKHVDNKYKKIFPCRSNINLLRGSKQPPQQNDIGGGKTPPQQNDTRVKYCTFINEPGFYSLVFRSKLPAAKKFQDWVFNKVLSIRKYGYYKLFKIENDEKRRVLIGSKKYFKHPVFTNYAASKNGDNEFKN